MNKKYQTIGVLEAKTHLSELLKRVARGDVITITNRGRAVARLVPCDDTGECGSRKEAVKGLAAIRKKVRGTGSIRSLIKEGRKR